MLIEPEVVAELLRHIRLRGVLHIGAHECEEMPFYLGLGLRPEDVYWIDALENKVAEARERGIPNVFQACISDADSTATFRVASNVQSSSILPFGTHAESYPWIYEQSALQLPTQTLRSWASKERVPIESLNFWNLDIQGAELMALRGAGELLRGVDAVYVEVNKEPVYQGCPMAAEIEEYLADFGLVRVCEKMTPQGWGDALFVRAGGATL